MTPAAQPKPPKRPDLPAVGTQLFYAESEDCEAFVATITKQQLSRKTVPGQWIVEYHSDGYNGEGDNGWDYGLPLAVAVAAAATQLMGNSRCEPPSTLASPASAKMDSSVLSQIHSGPPFTHVSFCIIACSMHARCR